MNNRPALTQVFQILFLKMSTKKILIFIHDW